MSFYYSDTPKSTAMDYTLKVCEHLRGLVKNTRKQTPSSTVDWGKSFTFQQGNGPEIPKY